MVAPKGNKNGIKLKDPDVRQIAFQQYCAHLAKGKSKSSFVFKHPSLTCHWETVDRYIKENPVEFPPIHTEIAKAEGYGVWEQVIEDGARGVNKDVNPACLQMKMRNQFSWDKDEKTTAPSPQLDGQLKILKSVDGEWKEVN